MSKLLVLVGALLIGALLFPAALWLGDRIVPSGRLAPDDVLAWRFFEHKARFRYSVREHAAGCKIELVPMMCCFQIAFHNKDGELVHTLCCGHDNTVFARWKGALYIADYSPSASGCSIYALDMSSGMILWTAKLRRNGQVGHSKFSNLVNIETDSSRIIVYGNESHGRYVEILDITTGITLANRKLDRESN